MTEKKPVRHMAPPKSAGEALWRMRWTLARRAVQLTVLLLFAGTARWGWQLMGEPVLDGTLTSSKFLGLIPLSDPLAALQRLAAGHMPTVTVLIGALIVLAVYGILGSRTFCGWMCPMNMVTDLADWPRRRLGLDADVVRTLRTNCKALGIDHHIEH